MKYTFIEENEKKYNSMETTAYIALWSYAA